MGTFFRTDVLESVLDLQWLKDYVEVCPEERFDQLVLAECYLQAYQEGELTLHEFLKSFSLAIPEDSASSLFERVVRGLAEITPKRSGRGNKSHPEFAKAFARIAKKKVGKAGFGEVREELKRMGLGHLAPTDNSVKNMLHPRATKKKKSKVRNSNYAK